MAVHGDGASWRSPGEFDWHDDPYTDSKQGLKDEGVVVKEIQDTVEEVPTSRVRRWWARLVRLNTRRLQPCASKRYLRLRRTAGAGERPTHCAVRRLVGGQGGHDSRCRRALQCWGA